MIPSPALSGISFRAWNSLHTDLVWIYEGTPGPQQDVVIERGNACVAWLVIRGQVGVEAGGESIQAKAGQWLFPTPDTRTQFLSARARILSLKFSAVWPDGRHLFEFSPGVAVVAEDHPQLLQSALQLFSHLRKFFPLDNTRTARELSLLDPTRPLPLPGLIRISELFSAWLGAYAGVMEASGLSASSPAAMDERLLRAVEAIQRHPLSEPLDDAALARAAGISQPHLHRIFRGRFGCTPIQHFQEYRLRHAQRALSATATPTKQIAYELGFRTPSHFCQWFRKNTGQTPSKYRQAARTDETA